MKILLTATVTPRVAGPLFLTDPAVRRQHYVESLRRWVPFAALSGATLVLVENSGEDLKRLVADAVGEVPGHVRTLSADIPAPELVARGKGATEAVMLDLVSDQCFDDPAEHWWKCTGRLFVQQLRRLRSSGPPSEAGRGTPRPGPRLAGHPLLRHHRADLA